MNFMRAFIGIPIPDELKPRITSIQERFSGLDIKFVEKENLHFNLKFFEELSEKDAEKLKGALEQVCKSFQPFEIEVAGLGAFPNDEYIRVFWIGVKDGYQTIVSLAESIDNALSSIGYPAEDRFVPHLTLGRVRSSRNKDDLLAKMNQLKDEEVGKMKVYEIKLFESKLGQNGSVYEEVFRVGL
jgi:RNA 2',3'-cyclic 3'-phosphodiesterase